MNEQFKATYFNEAAELVEEMEQCLLAMEAGTNDADVLNALFRAAHSIKGGALAFGFSDIANFTHVVESLLDQLREQDAAISHSLTDALLKARDVIAAMLAAKHAGEVLADDFGADVCSLLAAISAMPTQDQASYAALEVQHNTAQHIYVIHFAPEPHLFLTGNEPLRILRELQSLGTLVVTADSSRVPALAELDPTLNYLSWDMVLTTDASMATVREVFEFVEHVSMLTITERCDVTMAPASAVEEVASKAASNTIRVETSKVDSLIDMVGELLIAQAMLGTQAAQGHDVLATIETLSKRTRELQEAVMSVRMQPVKSLFARLPRVARDTANQLGKAVELVLSGEQTELDKTVIEKLGDPLTHMIRNAIDHGIEPAEQRRAAGKPEQGTVTLSAYGRSGRIILELSDDGAGIDRSKLLAKATESGVVSADKTLTDSEIDQLIFLPGLTTAKEVSNVSGRGVGMDVVRRNIEAIGGTVRIINRPSQGVTFILSLPLTLATLDGMVVRVGGEHYIIPMASIIETLRPSRSDIRTLGDAGDVVSVRGEYVRFHYLHRLFGIREAAQNVEHALLVLVETTQGTLGLVVDELLGESQVVVKSLAAGTASMRGFFGATILGDGRVSLILEVNDIAALGAALGVHHTHVA